MMQTTLSANGKGNRLSFFLRELINGKIQFLLWTVAFFMVLPVISIHEITGFPDTVKTDGLDKLRSVIVPLNAAMWVMIAAGLIAGIAAFSIFYDKKKAYFYLGLPVTRDFLFLTRAVTGAIPAIAAYIVNAFISILIFASNPHFGFFELFPAFIKLGGQTLLLFAWTYTITVFAASVTSRAGANVLFAVWCFAILPIYHACAALILELSAPNAYLPKYDAEIVYLYFNPIGRAGVLQSDMGDAYGRPYPSYLDLTNLDFYGSFAWYEVVLILLACALVIAAALFILRKRPAENAGESAAFPKVGEAIKISALIPAGILFGVFFNELFGIFGFFFGIIWGVFVIFLLLNLLLYRSGKKLFVGLKPAIIVTVLLVVLIILSLIIGNNIENRVYTVENTKSITVDVDPFGEVKLDPEKCGELLAYLESVKSDFYIGTTSIGYGGVAVEDVQIIDYTMVYSKHYRFKLVPKFGIGIEKGFRFDTEAEKMLFDAIRASSGDGLDLFANLFPADEKQYEMYGSSVDFHYGDPLLPKDYYANQYKELDRNAAAKLAERRVNDFMNGNMDGFRVGTAHYNAADNYVMLPIYITDGDIFGTEFCTEEEFLSYVTEMELFAYVSYDYANALVEKYGDEVYKYARNDFRVGTITDKAQIKECFDCSAGDPSGYGIYANENSYISFIFKGVYNGTPFTVNTNPNRDECPEFVRELIKNKTEELLESIK